jgi:hypothetical protein
MTVSAKILASQQAYLALPFKVRLETDSFGGAFRFATENEAVNYVAQQAAKYRRDRRHGRHSTWYAELCGNGRATSWDSSDITDGAIA